MISYTGTAKDLEDLWDVWIQVGSRLYSLANADISSNVRSRIYQIRRGETGTIHFRCWKNYQEYASSITPEYKFTLDEVKERFPQWADQIEMEILQAIL